VTTQNLPKGRLKVERPHFFMKFRGPKALGNRRHKPIVCPTSDLADSTRMYKLKGQANRLSPTLPCAAVFAKQLC